MGFLVCLQPREVVFLVFWAKGNVLIKLCMYGGNPFLGFYTNKSIWFDLFIIILYLFLWKFINKMVTEFMKHPVLVYLNLKLSLAGPKCSKIRSETSKNY